MAENKKETFRKEIYSFIAQSTLGLIIGAIQIDNKGLSSLLDIIAILIIMKAVFEIKGN